MWVGVGEEEPQFFLRNVFWGHRNGFSVPNIQKNHFPSAPSVWKYNYIFVIFLRTLSDSKYWVIMEKKLENLANFLLFFSSYQVNEVIVFFLKIKWTAYNEYLMIIFWIKIVIVLKLLRGKNYSYFPSFVPLSQKSLINCICARDLYECYLFIVHSHEYTKVYFSHGTKKILVFSKNWLFNFFRFLNDTG